MMRGSFPSRCIPEGQGTFFFFGGQQLPQESGDAMEKMLAGGNKSVRIALVIPGDVAPLFAASPIFS
jgi:hypothetical protein